MVELADDIAIGHASEGGMLEKLIKEIEGKKLYKISDRDTVSA